MIRTVIRFLGTLWGWLTIAALTAGLSLLAIDAQDRYRTALDLRVWRDK
jgi:hypothetical protein